MDHVAPTVPPQVYYYRVLYGHGLSYGLLSNPPRDLPWQITGIQAQFSEPVNGTVNSLQISGLGDLTMAGAKLSGSGTATLTWTFATPATNANVTTTLLSSGPNAIVDASGGNPLNGNPAVGAPSDYTHGLQVLYGDVNGDAVVNTTDIQLETQRIAGMKVPVADIYLDVNGDGVVNTTDLAIVTSQNGKKLV
jgi:hypothetical protein